MKTQTSFNERIARIKAREKAGENHGFVKPGVVDEVSGNAHIRRSGHPARGALRFLLGVSATFMLTVTVLVGGMMYLTGEADNFTAELNIGETLSGHLEAGQSMISGLLQGEAGQ